MQKYVESHNKNVVGFVPKDEHNTIDYKQIDAPTAEEPKKSKNEGIKLKMQMLQEKFSQNKTSMSMKAKIFERDLELDMLKRRKNLNVNKF